MEIIRYINTNHNHGVREASILEIDKSDKNPNTAAALRNEKSFNNVFESLPDKFKLINDTPEISSLDKTGDYIVDETEAFKYDPITGRLHAHRDICGARPSMHSLDTRSVYVFDFVNEVYVWSGLRAQKEVVDAVVELTKDKILPSRSRPDWALFSKVSEDMESALFQEKFFDWSNIARRELKEGATVASKIDETALLAEKEREDAIRAAGITDFPPASHDRLPISKTGDGLGLLDVSRGDGHIRDSDGRILNITTTRVILNGTDITKRDLDSDMLYLSDDTRIILEWEFSVCGTGEFQDKEIETTTSDLIKQLAGETLTRKNSGESGSRHEIAMAWFGQSVPAPTRMKLQKDANKSAIRLLQHGYEPAVFFRLLQPLTFGPEGSEAAGPKLHDTMHVYQPGVRSHSRASQVGFWSVDTLGKRYRAFPLSKFDGKFVRAEQYHATFRDKAHSAVLVDASALDDTVYLIFGSASMSESQKVFNFTTARNLQKARKCDNCKYFYYGNEPRSFKRNMFATWVDRETAHNVPEENLIDPDVYDILSNESSESSGNGVRISLEQARSGNDLPVGIDKARIEQYLSCGDFEEAFGITKEEFDSLPTWKKLRKKKEAELF